MTIASEITRLQNDKAAICTAIENKWVTVWNVSLDCYACCINEIQQGSWAMVEVLVVWGGGKWYNGWGWGWWVIRTMMPISWWTATVTVWWGWGTSWLTNWGASVVVSWDNSVCATWWTRPTWCGCAWWRSGCGMINWVTVVNYNSWWSWICCPNSTTQDAWWGWGGAWWAWCTGTCNCPWNWGVWTFWYWGWGWGWSWCTNIGIWVDWAWCWDARCQRIRSCNATGYWGWGWWFVLWTTTGGCWCQWVVDICYSLCWASWICCATWWNSCFTCKWMKVHRFTSSWTFCIVC